MVRVLFLQPDLRATAAKRIDMLQRAGFACESLACERNRSTGRLPACPIGFLGATRNGRYVKRSVAMLRALPRVRAAMRRSDLVYAFNQDMALMALAAGAALDRPIVLETGDVREIQVAGGMRGAAFRALDRLLTDASRLLVLTSDGYLAYYRRWLGVTIPHLILENKADAPFAAAVRVREPAPPARAPRVGRSLRIGCFGLFRDEWPLLALDALTRSNPDRFSVLLAGAPHAPIDAEEFQRRVESNPAVEFRGTYRHPDDLSALHDDVDVVLAGNAPKAPHGWSLTNRLYDACLFGKPLIVRAGTGDAAVVRRHDVGLIVGTGKADDAAAEIAAVPAARWESWRANAASLPPEVYSITTDVSALKAALVDVIPRPPERVRPSSHAATHRAPFPRVRSCPSEHGAPAPPAACASGCRD